MAGWDVLAPVLPAIAVPCAAELGDELRAGCGRCERGEGRWRGAFPLLGLPPSSLLAFLHPLGLVREHLVHPLPTQPLPLFLLARAHAMRHTTASALVLSLAALAAAHGGGDEHATVIEGDATYAELHMAQEVSSCRDSPRLVEGNELTSSRSAPR